VSKDTRRAARLARESRRVGGPAREAGAGTQPAGTVDTAAGSAPTRPVGRPTSGVGSRAGRRTTPRPGPAPSFFERYRTAIVTVAAVAIVAIAVGYVFIGSTAAAYTCDTQFNPSPTPPLSPDSSARLGFHQDDMGNSHITSTPVNYTYCPPASGSHFNLAGTLGPIPPRLYKPDDKIGPANWIHNLEHGGLVILYRNDSAGATAAGQQAFKDYGSTGFPASPICKVPAGVLSPVIARFDDMPHPFAVLVWDRVMYLDTWDAGLATKFYLTESERLDATGVLVAPPEKQCAGPSANPAPSVSLDASSAPASDVPSAAPSAAPSDAPSASPAPSAAPS
jgi:hypothetical protein